jgi:KaiC/GvpD/RAD55 family RecA-like ATPase
MTLFLTFREYVPQLEAKGAAFGLDVGGALTSGALQFLRVAPVELDAD